MIDGERIRVERNPFVNRYEIYTNCFSDKSINELRDNLLKNGVETTVLNLKQGGKIIAISRAKSKIAFYEGVKPFIVSSMQYKLSATPTATYVKP